jgi:hypothetical protein
LTAEWRSQEAHRFSANFVDVLIFLHNHFRFKIEYCHGHRGPQKMTEPTSHEVQQDYNQTSIPKTSFFGKCISSSGMHFGIPMKDGLPLFSKILEANASGELSNFALKEWIRSELHQKKCIITLFHATEADLFPSIHEKKEYEQQLELIEQTKKGDTVAPTLDTDGNIEQEDRNVCDTQDIDDDFITKNKKPKNVKICPPTISKIDPHHRKSSKLKASKRKQFDEVIVIPDTDNDDDDFQSLPRYKYRKLLYQRQTKETTKGTKKSRKCIAKVPNIVNCDKDYK